MSNKLIITLFFFISAFDMFVLSKAMHPTASENYINYFIKKNISTREYDSRELYDYDALREANPDMETWRFRAICQDKGHECVLPHSVNSSK